jgi:predicted DsbA family dithiol-disulfide isomerase
MKIEIWSDIMCPFCYIGKRNFESALKQFAHADRSLWWIVNTLLWAHSRQQLFCRRWKRLLRDSVRCEKLQKGLPTDLRF